MQVIDTGKIGTDAAAGLGKPVSQLVGLHRMQS
jgi:hypothetical protein